MSTPAIISVPSQGKGESKRHILFQWVILTSKDSNCPSHSLPMRITAENERCYWMGVYYTHGQHEKCDECHVTIKWVNSNKQPANLSKYLNTQVLFVFQKEVKLPQQLAGETWLALFPIWTSMYVSRSRKDNWEVI